MQRQSLGSPPFSKLYGGGHDARDCARPNPDDIPADDQKRNNKHSPSSSSSILNYKSFRFSFPWRPEKFVHAIPILTVICFLILYGFSHSPTQSDLAQIHGLKLPSEHLEIKADGDELMVPKKDNITAIQSLRNLKEIEKSYSLKSRSPRKLADF